MLSGSYCSIPIEPSGGRIITPDHARRPKPETPKLLLKNSKYTEIREADVLAGFLSMACSRLLQKGVLKFATLNSEPTLSSHPGSSRHVAATRFLRIAFFISS